MSKPKKYNYIVESTEEGRNIRYLAEVWSILDESARRYVVHKTFLQGGTVHSIEPVDDSYEANYVKRTFQES